MTTKRFQVALSFPGEYRDYVSQVAVILGQKLGQDAVFYDQWYTAELARPNMDTHLQAIYHDHAELIVPFLCADYERKQWCGLEWRAIRDLLKKRQDNDIMPLRFDDTEIPGLYGIDGYIDLRRHTPEQIAGFILQRVKPRQQSSTVTSIHSDRLPTVKGGFFGRTAELQLLTNAWANTTTRIIQFIAPGGTGKTKLLRHWLDHTTDIPVLIAWSFYSQGASEDKQTSATPFFSHAFAKLGSSRERFASEEDKGDHLAELLRGKRYVLVLDGLEPLQHGGAAMRGELKDKAIRQLLRQLARHPCGLCIITTRIALHELSDRDAPTVIRHDLQNLTAADGIQLLQSLGVRGSAAELGKAVREYGGHALALSLLGNVLRLRHQGDVRKRDTLKALVKATGNRDSRHAFKVMQAYAEWFAGEPELALLHLLGLFDHPIGQDVLQMLWDAQIPHLTAGIDEDEWLEAIASLREEHHLLSQHDGGGDLDCHPLIREYFGGQLQAQQPQAWQQAHERLYEYYKALPEKELPDTLEEMQPLFSAVAHGCAAGLHEKVWREVFILRIQRLRVNGYLWDKLGAVNENLIMLSHFFLKPWQTSVLELPEHIKINNFNWAGYSLVILGRLREALEPIQVGMEISKKQKDWCNAAVAARNLSVLQLTLGAIAEASISSQYIIDYSEKCGNRYIDIIGLTTHADTLHQAGKINDAFVLFYAAEQLQEEWHHYDPILFLLQGAELFRYCDLLLSQGDTFKVLNLAKESVDFPAEEFSLLDIALDQLTLGRAHLQKIVEETPPNLPLSGERQEQAAHWLEQAVAGLRAAGEQRFVPLGLLARAALHRHTRDFARARQDLQEVFDIADGSGMRLHLTDYHLEMARLLVAEEKEGNRRLPLQADVGAIGGRPLQYHIAEAERLINATGYHRRDQALLDLQQAIAKHETTVHPPTSPVAD
ncbi:TIR domain-containing protein [Thiothrix subterranea]|uniref:TIR domain-containing protein n=1 Tax=Thiothrix subterranea TaxID=2735563 RepID=UPI00192C6B3C|nr:TIR domain-containing protein [Thiothrix subterranea]QQZ29235.1 TIR domain-containing protein [Thiothrix subterranea]